MTNQKTLSKLAFILIVFFILSTLFCLTIGQDNNIEFSDFEVRQGYYSFILFGLPFSILLTLFWTIGKQNTKSRNLKIKIATVFISVFSFIFMIFFSLGNTDRWTNKKTLFINKFDSNVLINQQILLGEPNERIVKQTSFFIIFRKVTDIDTSRINKNDWTFINADYDIQEL